MRRRFFQDEGSEGSHPPGSRPPRKGDACYLHVAGGTVQHDLSDFMAPIVEVLDVYHQHGGGIDCNIRDLNGYETTFSHVSMSLKGNGWVVPIEEFNLWHAHFRASEPQP